MPVEPSTIEPFYRAAVLGLRALAARAGRAGAFGPQAEARWKVFRGALGDADRIDLLLRAAAKGNPAAFAPRLVFPLEGLSDDEPFGPDWPGMPPVLAAELAKELALPVTAATDSAAASTLEAVARAWSLPNAPFAPSELERVAPASRLVAAGAGAILPLAARFDRRADLDLAQQVLFVTLSPGERHLAGLAVALVGSRGEAQVASGAAPLPDRQRAAFARPSALLLAPDAPAQLREAAERTFRSLQE